MSVCCVGELGGLQDVLSFMANHTDGMIKMIMVTLHCCLSMLNVKDKYSFGYSLCQVSALFPNATGSAFCLRATSIEDWDEK